MSNARNKDISPSRSPTFPRMNSICATQQGTLLAVGFNGVFLLSGDSGKSWTRGQASRSDFYIATCLSNGELRAIGPWEIFQINTDASVGQNSESWNTTVSFAVPFPRQWVTSAYSSSESNISVAGTYGVLLTSQDNGKTWQQIPFETKHHLIGITGTKKNELVALDTTGNFFLNPNSAETLQKFSTPNNFFKTSQGFKAMTVTKQDTFIGSGFNGLVVSYQPQQQKWQLLVRNTAPRCTL